MTSPEQGRLRKALAEVAPNPGRFILLLLAGFVSWGLVLSLTVQPYASIVGIACQWVLELATPLGFSVDLSSSFPRFAWTATGPDAVSFDDSVSTWLVCYNGALYLSLVSVCLWRHPTRAALFVATGLPILFLFHAGDVLLAVDSRLQTRLFPEHYAFWLSFDLRFILVKFLHHFSMLALKQTLPILILIGQYAIVGRLVEPAAPTVGERTSE